MGKPVVFVIGASGNVGLATVKALSSKYADQVEIKAGVRNPEKADALKSLPLVTVTKACMGDEGLVATFVGVDSLFIVSPSAENRASLTNSTADAAKKAGVKHIIAVSGPGAASPELTSIGRAWYEIEKHISSLGISYTFVRLPCFLNNFFALKESVSSQNAIYFSIRPDIPISFIAMEDAGNAVATMLVNPSPYRNSTHTLISDTRSLNEVVGEFSIALGKKISYVQQPSDEELEKKLTAMGFEESMLKMTFIYAEIMNSKYPLTASDENSKHPSTASEATSTYTKITGESPTSVKAWITKYSAMFK